MFFVFVIPIAECSTVLTTIPISSDMVSCRVLSSCTAIECCVDVTPLGKTFTVLLEVDACNKELTIGIDEYKTKLPYEFGMFSFNYLSVWVKYKVINIVYYLDNYRNPSSIIALVVFK